MSKAIDAFEKAILLEPKMMGSYLYLVQIYEDMGQIELAVETMKTAISIDPSSSELSAKLSQFYYSNNQKKNALSVLESAYAANKDDPIILNKLASRYLEDPTQLHQAFELASLAYEKNNKDPAIADTLRWIYYRNGVYRQAQLYLQEAENWILEEMANNSVMVDNVSSIRHQEVLHIVRYHLGMAMIKNGQLSSGADKLEAAIKQGLEGDDLIAAKLALEGILH
jgi:tetratricopeptide (TPR) repeat protein